MRRIRASAVLGRHRPGSEGNLASDQDIKDPVTPVPNDEPASTAPEAPAPRTLLESRPRVPRPKPASEPAVPVAEPADLAGARRDGTLDLVELKDMSIVKLNTIAKELGVVGVAGLRKQELI
ncbi:MAG: Rho termination factor N-terminal domain-containing protein, partial [Bryobacterales bacterium]|nr:Rho termination factor N-terminal domain-containing protein [Bryobacterales bacterium]